MIVRNNLFGRGYVNGIWTSHKGGQCDVWQNNRFEDNGDLIPGGGGGGATRGPTGRWPADFPAYTDTATLTTNGSAGDLNAKIASCTTSDCVIQHPGHVDAVIGGRRQTSGRITIRPPIGQRNDFNMGGMDIEGDNILVAGYSCSNGGQVTWGQNSGIAWSECDGSTGTFQFISGNSSTEIVDVLFYEVVHHGYGGVGICDRMQVQAHLRAQNRIYVYVTGSYLTGGQQPPDCHGDLMQVQLGNSADGDMIVEDSVLWPSDDKVFQGFGTGRQIRMDNVYIAEPSIANAYWGTSLGGHSWGGAGWIGNSTIVGNCFTNPTTPFDHENNILFQPYWPAINDINNSNTEVFVQPATPPPPSSGELDTIWSP
jgi:hypothetical protein